MLLKKKISFVLLFLFSFNFVFAQILIDYPEYSIKTEIETEGQYKYLELFSDSKKSTLLVKVNNKNDSKYQVLYETHSGQKWSVSSMYYSEKSDTFYYYLNTSPTIVNGKNVYYDSGLFAFTKNGTNRYFIPEKWLLIEAWDAFLSNDDYKGFLDFVYSISDSCDKEFCINVNGELITGEKAVAYMKENNLFSYNYDGYIFLNKYLRRIEKGKITEKSAFTLNGVPELKDTICKTPLNLNTKFFISSEDGIWILSEYASPVERVNEKGQKYEEWIPDYYKPYLLEDKNGKIVRQQDIHLKHFKIYPCSSIGEVSNSCTTYKGWLLMRDMDGRSWWAYKNSQLFTKGNLQQTIDFLDKNTNTEENKSEKKSFWIIISAVLFILLFASIVIIIFINSKKYEQHLTIKDKKLIFNIQNKERTKISRDLHDSVVQTIRTIRTDVEMLDVKKEDEMKKQQIIKEITDSVVLLRNICYNLSPAEISLAENRGGTTGNHLELLSVIDTLCKQFSLKTKIPCTINMDADFKVPVFTLETSKYVIRVFQEILTNIEKHSFATSVNILISNDKTEDREMLKLVVIDDGIGCELSEMTRNKHHFGVRNIIESMNLIGGKVEFYSKQNEGMNTVLKVPCDGSVAMAPVVEHDDK